MDDLEGMYIDKLKDLALYWKYLHHELSIGDLAKSKKIPIKIINEKLELNGYLVKISNKTPADNSIIPIILNIKY